MNPTEMPSAPTAVVLRLMVRNHPVCDVARMWLVLGRSFNLDAIICVPIEDSAQRDATAGEGR